MRRKLYSCYSHPEIRVAVFMKEPWGICATCEAPAVSVGSKQAGERNTDGNSNCFPQDRPINSYRCEDADVTH